MFYYQIDSDKDGIIYKMDASTSVADDMLNTGKLDVWVTFGITERELNKEEFRLIQEIGLSGYIATQYSEREPSYKETKIGSIIDEKSIGKRTYEEIISEIKAEECGDKIAVETTPIKGGKCDR